MMSGLQVVGVDLSSHSKDHSQSLSATVTLQGSCGWLSKLGSLLGSLL